MAEVPYQTMHNPDQAPKTVPLDPESQVEIRGMSFSEESIRKAFIRKVYLILTVSTQLENESRNNGEFVFVLGSIGHHHGVHFAVHVP